MKAGKIIVIVLLLVLCLAAFYPIGKKSSTAMDASEYPWESVGLTNEIINVVPATDADGAPVYKQQTLKKESGGTRYYKNGNYVHVFKNADGVELVKVFIGTTSYADFPYFGKDADGNVTYMIKDIYDEDIAYAYAAITPDDPTYSLTSDTVYAVEKNAAESAVYEYYKNSEVEPVLVLDEEGNPIPESKRMDGAVTLKYNSSTRKYEYVQVAPTSLIVYDAESPWDAGVVGATDADLLGQTITVADPRGGEDITVTVPSSATAFADATSSTLLYDVAWQDLTNAQREEYTSSLMSDEAKELALALYFNANKTFIMADYSAYYSNSETQNLAAGMNNAIDLNIIEVRKRTDDAAYLFRQDFRVERDIPLTAIMSMDMLVSVGLELTCGERRYFDTSMDRTLYERTTSANINDKGEYATDWAAAIPADEMKSGKYKVADNVYRVGATEVTMLEDTQTNAVRTGDTFTQYGYTHSAHIIASDTIADAYVAYVDDTFKIYVRLDLSEKGDSKATQDVIAGIRDGSGDPNAYYTDVYFNMDLWQNGYYKTFRQIEAWEGTAAGFPVASSFDYYETFFYGEDNVSALLDSLVDSWDAAKAEYAD